MQGSTFLLWLIALPFVAGFIALCLPPKSRNTEAWLAGLTMLGLLVVIYARYYMSPTDPMARFYSAFLAFMGAMLGVVLSGNLIQLVFFWELTSLFSFLLICYWHHRADARRGAYMALMVTGAGGLCLLAGVMLLGHIVGS